MILFTEPESSAAVAVDDEPENNEQENLDDSQATVAFEGLF